MKALDRKLLRDLWHLRGQVISVALVVACGITCFVTMRSAHDALVYSRASYYRHYRFADVFAQLKRAPEALSSRIAEIPGVAGLETRVVAEVTLDVPGLEVPATGRLARIELHEGDPVDPGQIGAFIHLLPLDARQRAEVVERVEAAQASDSRNGVSQKVADPLEPVSDLGGQELGRVLDVLGAPLRRAQDLLRALSEVLELVFDLPEKLPRFVLAELGLHAKLVALSLEVAEQLLPRGL